MWVTYKFITRGSTNTGLFELFWEHCQRALELESIVGAPHCRHIGVGADVTNSLFYAPSISSVSQLSKVTAGVLKKDCNARDTEFKVLGEKCGTLQYLLSK